jgi:hypothetical protein
LESNDHQKNECNASSFEVLGAIGTLSFGKLSKCILTRLQQPMCNPTNEPSREPIHKPTKRLGQDALLPVNLSSKGGLCHNKNSERVMFSNQGQDNEIQSNSTDSSNTQPSNWHGPKQRSLIISARVPFATFRSNLSSGLVYCWVHSHTGFESVTSSKKVSCTVFTLLSCEPVTLSKKVSCSVFALLACEPVTSSTKVSYSVFALLARDTVTFTTRVSCNTFTSLVCELVPSKNQIKRDKSTPTFQLVVASILNNNASSFDDKPSSTFQLVVVSVDWISKGISNKPFRTLRLDRIKSKMPFTFQLIVGSKQGESKQMQTCKPRMIFKEDPRPISMLVVYTS